MIGKGCGVLLLCGGGYGHVFNLFVIWKCCLFLCDMDGIGCAVVDATICFSLSCLCVSLQHRGSPNLVPIVIAKVPFYQTDIDSCIGHAKHFAAFISIWVRHLQKSESYLLLLLHITLHNSYSCTQHISTHASHLLSNPTATLFNHVRFYITICMCIFYSLSSWHFPHHLTPHVPTFLLWLLLHSPLPFFLLTLLCHFTPFSIYSDKRF